MRVKFSVAFTFAMTLSASAELVEPIVAPGRDPAEVQKIVRLVEGISQEMAIGCPKAEANDQVAFNTCRNWLFNDSKFKNSLTDFVLWGRVTDPKKLLKDSNLTQFGPDVLTGMYVSLFMFNNKYKIEYLPEQNLYRVDLSATFRNRLAPGQFPYPFWHEDNKWNTYQDANAILLFVDPEKIKVKYAQFTPFSTAYPTIKTEKIVREFDGKWLWTDENGKTQPQATLFDGIFSAENPELQKLDVTYKEFALSLRQGTCLSCHVPNNPSKMKKLVLLQSPAHAAAEIKRVIDTTHRDKMPVNEWFFEEPLKDGTKNALLENARAFEKVVDAARAWEAQNNATKATSVLKPKPISFPAQ